MKIYTKTGDAGETSLLGGKRVSKNHLRIEACGTIDELNAQIGFALALLEPKEHASDIITMLITVQHTLFTIGSHVAQPSQKKILPSTLPSLQSDLTSQLEQAIDFLEEQLPQLREFILPGGSSAAAALHICRSICRRAERCVIQLKQTEKIPHGILSYLNRLSDYLFVAARTVNHRYQYKEYTWNKEIFRTHLE
ncbi:MAG TPA: cob(I)yrinic acid a,c-diamide adenosyltransferase [Patescibacteria group bacterium]|nr:cob(I)yrinic acid a,c-diamide adenosyltransferase [Patescibacteria group bacterium]